MEKIKNALWVVGKCARYCFLQIALYSVILLFLSGISIAANIIQKNMVNELIANISVKQISSLFIILIVVYAALFIIEHASKFINIVGKNLVRFNTDKIFRKLFMLRVAKTPQESFFKKDYMDKFTLVNKNLTRITEYIMNLLILLLRSISELTGVLVLFAIYMPYLLIYALVIAVVYSIIGSVIARKKYKLSKEQIPSQRYEGYYGSLLTEKNHAKELRVYKTRGNLLKIWTEYYKKLKSERLTLTLKNNNLSNITNIVTYVMQAAVIFILLISAYNGRIDVGTAVMLFGLAGRCNSQIKNVVDSMVSEMYYDMLHADDYVNLVKPVTKTEWRQVMRGDTVDSSLPFGLFEYLSLENIEFQYHSGEKNAVDDVSLTIKKGEVVSILGYNGSGKTTLSKIISGMLEPTNGKVTINGHEITNENKFEVFNYFGIAFQEYAKFILTLADNVAIGRIEKMNDDEMLESAIEKGNLKSLTDKLKYGKDTILGKKYDDEGTDLSGGEWQRVILSRSYMGEPEFIIMDEPTASIDPLEEYRMLSHFREILNGKTALLISHRIGFARLADRIIMMKDGKITEQGTHEELLNLNGYYASLFNAQKKLYDDEMAVSV